MKILILVICLFISSTVFGATTGTLSIEGIVAEILSIEVIPSDGSSGDGTYSGLDLHTTTTLLEVATINEMSNSANGYKILVSYDGTLENSASGASEFVYSLFYNNVVVPVGLNQEVTSVGSGGYNVNKSVKVSYTGISQENLVAGTYSDIVTFTIQAN